MLMHLTKEEEKMFDGEYGLLYEWAIRFLAAYGDAMKADRLVQIESACMKFTTALPGCPNMKELLPKDVYGPFLDGKMAVPTYTDTMPDIEYWEESGHTPDMYEKEMAVERLARKSNIFLTGTCTPYLSGWIPTMGSHVATTESSLWVYVNSVLGARTNRESYPGIYAIAITGKTINGKLHTDEGRRGNLLVKVKTKLESSSDYDALGYFVEKESMCDIPVFVGMRRGIGVEQLKGLGAALTTAGAVGLYHIVGMTPEAQTEEAAFGGSKPSETIEVERKDIDQTYEYLSTKRSGKVDYVVLGCPHLTIKELGKVANLLDDKKIHKDVRLIVMTSTTNRQMATRMGITDIINSSGGHLLCDCWWPIFNAMDNPSDKLLATNAAKCAHYCRPSFPGIDTWVGKMENCINSAIDGVIR